MCASFVSKQNDVFADLVCCCPFGIGGDTVKFQLLLSRMREMMSATKRESTCS